MTPWLMFLRCRYRTADGSARCLLPATSHREAALVRASVLTRCRVLFEVLRGSSGPPKPVRSINIAPLGQLVLGSHYEWSGVKIERLTNLQRGIARWKRALMPARYRKSRPLVFKTYEGC